MTAGGKIPLEGSGWSAMTIAETPYSDITLNIRSSFFNPLTSLIMSVPALIAASAGALLVYNFGGFTDGDRAVFLAEALGASLIVVAGMDFPFWTASFLLCIKRWLVSVGLHVHQEIEWISMLERDFFQGGLLIRLLLRNL